MFNFIDIYIFITMSGCVCSDPVHYIVRGSLMLLRRPASMHISVVAIIAIVT